VKRAELLERVTADNLITEFGGNHKFDFAAYIEEVRQKELAESKHEDSTIDSTTSSSSTTTANKPSSSFVAGPEEGDIDADHDNSAANSSTQDSSTTIDNTGDDTTADEDVTDVVG